MTYLSELSKDQPYDSLDNAIWWVEYVMRHKGISHLRFSESDKPWYQRYDTDVIAFLSVVLFTLACVTVSVILQIFRILLAVLRKHRDPNVLEIGCESRIRKQRDDLARA